MSLLSKIQQDSVAAMKSGNSVEVDILKMAIAALKNAQIAKEGDEELSEQEEIKVVFSEAKKIKDSIQKFEEGGRDDLAKREKEQLQYIEKYLPQQASEEDVTKEVDAAIDELQAEGMKDMGRVMGVVMKKLQGKADGAVVNQIVKEKLSN